LYSEKDVMRLRWVKARIEEGMQTAQAIQALRHQEASGQLISETIAASEAFAQERLNPPIAATYQNRLVAALLQRDLQKADEILGDALASSSPESLILGVIGPALAEIGDLWEQRQASVAIEHLATNYLRQRLLMWMLSGPPVMSRPPIVLACAPNEWHEGSLLVLGALLRRRRWPVVYLGQAVPLSDLATFVRDLHPSMVILVAMTETTASELVEWPQWLPEAAKTGRPAIGYGGRIFSTRPEWRLRAPGIFLGPTFQEGIETIERLLA
jgi:methanogenic corrinoid protein MtbC1